MKRIVVLVSVNLTFLLVLWAGLNIIAIAYIKSTANYKHWTEYEGNVELSRKAHEQAGTSDIQHELWRQGPGLRLHPSIRATHTESTGLYEIGLEGIRYEPGWTDQDVENLLRAESIYVLGGSTTVGVGVPGDQTLVAWLNRMADSERFVNLGIVSYDSHFEVRRLVYLLQKGYRPKKVIFVDGLNDLTAIPDLGVENMIDIDRLAGFWASPILDAGVPGYPSERGVRESFLYSMPLYHLIVRFLDALRGDGGKAVDPGTTTWSVTRSVREQSIYVGKDAVALAESFVVYYQALIQFADQLGRGFGFEPHHVFQPVGLADAANEMRFDQATTAFLAPAVAVVRSAIGSGRLDMIDCSEVLADHRRGTPTKRHYYVDPTHYSPLGNELVADCILNRALRRGTAAEGMQ